MADDEKESSGPVPSADTNNSEEKGDVVVKIGLVGDAQVSPSACLCLQVDLLLRIGWQDHIDGEVRGEQVR